MLTKLRMDKNILKVDLDMHSKYKCIKHLSTRFAYMHDIELLNFNDNIESIQLLYKSSYACKIFLKHNIKEHFIIMFQLILGSDWMKESNTILNHYKGHMEYSNRMFDVKRYKGGEIKHAKYYDITKKVKYNVNNNNRIKFKK